MVGGVVLTVCGCCAAVARPRHPFSLAARLLQRCTTLQTARRLSMRESGGWWWRWGRWAPNSLSAILFCLVFSCLLCLRCFRQQSMVPRRAPELPFSASCTVKSVYKRNIHLPSARHRPMNAQGLPSTSSTSSHTRTCTRRVLQASAQRTRQEPCPSTAHPAGSTEQRRSENVLMPCCTVLLTTPFRPHCAFVCIRQTRDQSLWPTCARQTRRKPSRSLAVRCCACTFAFRGADSRWCCREPLQLTLLVDTIDRCRLG